MPDRQRLINEVKDIYAGLADAESQDHFVHPSQMKSPEAYYEALLSQVINGIDQGQFDSMSTGRDIVDAVAKNHAKWDISIS